MDSVSQNFTMYIWLESESHLSDFKYRQQAVVYPWVLERVLAFWGFFGEGVKGDFGGGEGVFDDWMTSWATSQQMCLRQYLRIFLEELFNYELKIVF